MNSGNDNPYQPPSKDVGASAPRETWWTRPCGGADVMRLALPLIISTGSWSLMHFVDRMFLLGFSAEAMAAAMPAGMLFWTLTCFPVGITSYVNTFVAQYYGARQYSRIGAVMAQGIWFSLAILPLFLLLIPLCPWLFWLARHEPELAALETVYLQVLLLGGGAVVLAAVQSSFFTGRGHTRVVMLVDLFANIVNLVLDYFWIFGVWGFPRWGAAGAAAATVVAQWSKVAIFWWLLSRGDPDGEYGLKTNWRWDGALMRRLLKFGGSSGFQMLVEAGAYTVLVMCISALGKVEAAATTLAFTINNVAFIPMIGVHIAVSTLVGQQLGNNRPDLAARATWTALVLALGYTGLFVVAYVFAPELFLAAHEAWAEEGDFAAIQPVTMTLLRFVAVYCLFDALQLVFVGAIKGAGDTRFMLLATATTAAIAITAGRWGQRTAADPLIWWWIVATGWVLTLSTVYTLRFLQGRWRSMRVIEPTVAEG